MLAKLATAVPADEERWGFEVKWDGIRLLAKVESGRLQVMTRNLIDATPRFPAIEALSAVFSDRDVVLDGEIVGFDQAGRATFEALQQRSVFDVLALDGRSLIDVPYIERRGVLESLALEDEHWRTPPYSSGGGHELLATTREQRLEGIVAKRLDSRYEPGKRSGTWIKLKHQQRQEFVIGGWVAGAGKRAGTIGALVIGYWDNGEFVSAGKVGTGFTDATLEELTVLLAPLARPTSPFTRGDLPRHVQFVEPQLVCEVEFTEWTSRTAQLRHPSFKGLRTDKAASEVVREG